MQHIAFLLQLAESIGFEPMRHFRNDSLANCCLNHSANFPYSGGNGGIRTHGAFRLDGFQDRCLKPLSHISFGGENRI